MSIELDLAILAVGEFVVKAVLPHVGEAAAQRRHDDDMYRRGYLRRTVSQEWESKGFNQFKGKDTNDAIAKLVAIKKWCKGNFYVLNDREWSYTRGLLRYINALLTLRYNKHIVPPAGLIAPWMVEPITTAAQAKAS